MENKQLKSFKDLLVWQKAVDTAVLVYLITDGFPKSELYGIVSQMRRAVISISSNLAEGFKRRHKREKLQFYNIAHGSAAELESQIEVGRKLGFMKENEYQRLIAAIIEVSKMLDGLIRSQSFSSKSYILSAIFCILFIFSASQASAAVLFPSQTQINVKANQQFEVSFLLNTENEDLNAVEGKINFPSDLLEMKEVNDGNSIINFWIQRPTLNSQSSILYSGIVPGGYNGAQGLLFSTTFFAKKNGSGIIKFEGIKILRNDGLGTQAETKISDLRFVISDNGTQSVVPVIQDKDAPESFTPAISKDAAIFNGKYFVAFSAADKGSGIDYYQVKEERRYKIGSWEVKCGRWKVAVSPYLLRDQGLSSAIYVKATDKSGNDRVVSLAPLKEGSDLVDLNAALIIIFGILFIFVITKLCFERCKTKKI